MNSASFLVIPSIWYEGFPMVILEAYSAGLPVLGSKIGSVEKLLLIRLQDFNLSQMTQLIFLKKLMS